MSHISKLFIISLAYSCLLSSQATEVDGSPHNPHYPLSQGFSQRTKSAVLTKEESNVQKIDLSDSKLKVTELQGALKQHGHTAKQLDI